MTKFWLDIIKVKENIKNLPLGDLPLHQKCIKYKLLNWDRLYKQQYGGFQFRSTVTGSKSLK